MEVEELSKVKTSHTESVPVVIITISRVTKITLQWSVEGQRWNDSDVVVESQTVQSQNIVNRLQEYV